MEKPVYFFYHDKVLNSLMILDDLIHLDDLIFFQFSNYISQIGIKIVIDLKYHLT